MNYDYVPEIKQAYLDKHIICGDFKISFDTQRVQNPNRQPTQKYELERFVTGMKIFCNDIDVLKNRNKNFKYEECFNISKKYKSYKYVIYVTYKCKWDKLFD